MKKVIKVVLIIVAIVFVGFIAINVYKQYSTYSEKVETKKVLDAFMSYENKDGKTMKDIEEEFSEHTNFYYRVELDNKMLYLTMTEKGGSGRIVYGYHYDLDKQIFEMVSSTD